MYSLGIGWRKISFYFNVSYEIKDKTIEFDGNRDVQRAEFVVRAHMLYVFCLFGLIYSSHKAQIIVLFSLTFSCYSNKSVPLSWS